MGELELVLVAPEATLRSVMHCIERNGKGIALVADDDRKLLGVITDGDVRREILADVPLETTAAALLAERRARGEGESVTAPAGTGDAELLAMMSELYLRQVPLVDRDGRVEGLACLSDLTRDYELPLRAVVMAGGFGTRMRPLTDQVPKPMLPVGGRPLLERIVEQLRDSGVRQLNVTTHYQAQAISDHFRDGRDFGVSIEYTHEDEPLGTAGALGLVDTSEDELVLVVNGDIMTRLDFRAMVDFHRDHKADMTAAVLRYEYELPYGVVRSDGPDITAVVEKPRSSHFVLAGIYLLAAEVCGLVPRGEHCDMPDLIERALAGGRRVVSFPIHEYWADIGQPEDYERVAAALATQHGATG